MVEGQLKFADWLIATGKAMGFSTNTALARAINVPQPTVSRWKSGAKPRVEHLVNVSELFGIELKTLLVLSGHIKGEISPEDLAPPASQAERIIDSMGAPEQYKAELRMFWLAREREELRRLELLSEGIESAYKMVGRGDRHSLQPWIESALSTELPLHVQHLQNKVDPPPNTTWILQVHPSVQTDDPHDVLLRDVREGVRASQTIYEEDGWYEPTIHALDGHRWLLRGPSSETLIEARETLQAMLRNYPSLKLQELEVVYAPEEEEGPSER